MNNHNTHEYFSPSEVIPERYWRNVKLLTNSFKEKFPDVEPAFYARAPGRVNIIGEHIDYCGYAVLPMAIEKDVSMVFCENKDGIVRLKNYDPEYNDVNFEANNIDMENESIQWSKYSMCALRGLHDKFPEIRFKGIDAVVRGTIPAGAGLSSSSALVVCAAICFIIVNDLKLTKSEIAELCAVAERYIGMQGGGMDQAIACLGEVGRAKYITFNPLALTDVKLPNEVTFVVADSMTRCKKAETSSYNTRVAECRIGSKIIAKLLGYNHEKVLKPKDLQDITGLTLERLKQTVKEKLHKEPYSKDEICIVLGINKKYLDEKCLSANTLNVSDFFLQDRLCHVFSEAKRVEDFKSSCDCPKEPGTITKLGGLMNESHESCNELFDCSSKELNDLVSASRRAGAVGSRLTGAGWGGCTISMIYKKDEDIFYEKLKSFYKDKDGFKETDSVFISKPSAGIEAFKLKNIVNNV